MTVNKLSVKATAFAAAIFWGASVLGVGILNLKWNGYGAGLLALLDSLYPGYDGLSTLRSVLVGTGYAVVDGAIAGTVFAWLYNLSASGKCCGEK